MAMLFFVYSVSVVVCFVVLFCFVYAFLYVLCCLCSVFRLLFHVFVCFCLFCVVACVCSLSLNSIFEIQASVQVVDFFFGEFESNLAMGKMNDPLTIF